MKVQTAWIKSIFYADILPSQVFFSEICESFINTFDNTNNSVELLQNRWCIFMAVKLFIIDTIFKRKYESKKSQIKSNLNLVDICARLMIHVSPMK